MNSFVIFDLETTGLTPKDNQIIEIAAKKIDFLGNELGTFHKFVELYKVEYISEFITNLTTITDEYLINNGEEISYVMESFGDFIHDSILVAQNQKFDMSFLMEYYLEKENIAFSPCVIDTIDLAKKVFPNKNSYKLASLVEYCGVDYDSMAHHQADYDVLITTKVLMFLLKSLNFNGDIEKLLIDANFKKASDKQMPFLTSLMGKSNHHVEKNHVFSISSASFHIDYYLNKK